MNPSLRFGLTLLGCWLLCSAVTSVPASLGWGAGLSSRLALGACYTLSLSLAALILMGGLNLFLSGLWGDSLRLLPLELVMCFAGWSWMQLTREFGVWELSPALSVGGLFVLGYVGSFALSYRISHDEMLPREKIVGWVLFSPPVMIATLLMAGVFNIPFVYVAGKFLR